MHSGRMGASHDSIVRSQPSSSRCVVTVVSGFFSSRWSSLKSGGMPNGRCMLRAIYRHFQFQCDRVGMLAERNLLNIKMAGDSVAQLEAFRDKYLYVITTIPVEDLPKESTLFNHLIDELEKVSVLKPKVEKAREARQGFHRRTTEWLLSRVDVAIDLHQQRVNRQEFDKSLQAKPEARMSTQGTLAPHLGITTGKLM